MESSIEVGQNLHKIEENLYDICIELDGCHIGIIKAIAVLFSSDHELSVIDKVDGKKKSCKARIDEMNNWIFPKNGHDSKN